MKALPFLTFCFGFTLCLAQTEPDYNSNQNDPTTEEYPDQNINNSENSGQDYDGSSTGNTGEWSRSDYYETKPSTERVQYYSGGYRGTNIINPPSEDYYDRSDLFREKTNFPDIVRYYSGGYYGNNIINKNAVDRVKDEYMNNPVEESRYRNNTEEYPGQPQGDPHAIPPSHEGFQE